MCKLKNEQSIESQLIRKNLYLANKECIGEKLYLLNFNDYKSENFEISNGGKTIKVVKGKEYDKNSCISIFSKNDNLIMEEWHTLKLSNTQRRYIIYGISLNYSIKIDNCDEFGIMLGFASTYESWTYEWLINLENGRYINPESMEAFFFQSGSFSIKNGDIVTICFEAKYKMMYCLLNGSELTYRQHVSYKKDDRGEMYTSFSPCVVLKNVNTQLTLV